MDDFAPEAKVLWSKPLAGGISAQMTAFEAEFREGDRQKLIARQPSPWKFRNNQRVAEQEFYILGALKLAGLLVPSPSHLDRATSEFPEPFFIVEYIDGEVDLKPKDLDRYLAEYATQRAGFLGERAN